MDHEAYIRTKHPHPRGGDESLALIIHNAVAHVTIPIGWSADGDYSTVEKMAHIRLDILKATPRQILDKFAYEISRTEAFLTLGKATDNFTPSDDDVRRLFSTAYHLLNPDEKFGAADRAALAKALEVLKVGEVLPDRSDLHHNPFSKSDKVSKSTEFP